MYENTYIYRKGLYIYVGICIKEQCVRLYLHAFVVLPKQLSINWGLNVWLFSLQCYAFGFWKQPVALAVWSLTFYHFWRCAIQSLFTVTSMEKLTS